MSAARNVTMPEMETKKPRSRSFPQNFGVPVKQWMMPFDGISRRMPSVSPSASRVWMTAGGAGRRAGPGAEPAGQREVAHVLAAGARRRGVQRHVRRHRRADRTREQPRQQQSQLHATDPFRYFTEPRAMSANTIAKMATVSTMPSAAR